LVGVAVALGVLGDVLFDGHPLGLNVLVFTACFVGALALLLRIGNAELHRADGGWQARSCFSEQPFCGTTPRC
jgi:hypothetical protein